MRAVWITVFMVVLIWSGIAPKDFMTWCLEVFPAVLGGVVLWVTRERFPLTTMLYVLILIHCVILMVGGHYTYAEVFFSVGAIHSSSSLLRKLRRISGSG